jgi:hypothetical protein
MKLPRWFVICLLVISGISIPIAFGVWWCTVPSRTVRALATALGERSLDRANGLMTGKEQWILEQDATLINLDCSVVSGSCRLSPEAWQWVFDDKNVEYEHRSVADLLTGTARFRSQDGFLLWEVRRSKLSLIEIHGDRWHPFMRLYVRDFLKMDL